MTLVELIGGPMDGFGYEWPEGFACVQEMRHFAKPIYHLTQCGKALFHGLVHARNCNPQRPVPTGEELV